MKNLMTKTILGLCLLLPLTATAAPDDEITMRVMGMHEDTKESVLQVIELPAAIKERVELYESNGDVQQGTGEHNMEIERIEMGNEDSGRIQEQSQEGYQGPSPKH